MTPAQARVLTSLAPATTERGFYLAGGTALALRFGHRRSVDLDWFTREPLADPQRLAHELRQSGIPLKTTATERGTLYGTISGVKVSFIEFGYPDVGRPSRWADLGCTLASPSDLACMKLSALAQRGARRDFVDLYALGIRFKPLRDLLSLYKKKFSVKDEGHLLFALAYFDDAEREPMPRMLWDSPWPDIKATVQHWVKDYAGG
jgi:hypothetical protein